MDNSYRVILADPPWWYSNRSANHITRFGGGARAHYEVMRDSEILAMADFVKNLAAADCALFLWSTCPRLDFAIEVVNAWGFRYATVAFHWLKTNRRGEPIYGPGHYTGSNLEVVLLGIKGKMTPNVRLVPSAIIHPRLRHSEKPQLVHRRIERMYGDVPRIELFARHRVAGWDAWGHEVGAFDEETLSLGNRA